jgi:15-cis-phytoene synthase
VADPAHRHAVAGVVAEVLDRAEGYYRSADLGLANLPLREAWSIAAARGIYADIGAVVRRRGPRAWDRRAVVPAPRKLYRMGWALLRAVTRGRPAPAAG